MAKRPPVARGRIRAFDVTHALQAAWQAAVHDNMRAIGLRAHRPPRPCVSEEQTMSSLRVAMYAAFAAAALAFVSPAPASAQPAPDVKPAPFGEQVTLTAKTVIYMKGSADWDKAYATLVDAFKSVQGYLDKQGIKATGPAMTIYTFTDDNGFEFQAAIPIAEAPKDPPHGVIAMGKTPEGKALKFSHHGSYDGMDTLYEAISNHLDEKKLEAQDVFFEEYVTDPVKTPPDKLVVNVYVPLK
jgi:effector-binding domain-containing protein